MLDITAHCLEEVRFFGRNFAKADFVPSVVLGHHPQARRPAVHRVVLVVVGKSLAHCLLFFFVPYSFVQFRNLLFIGHEARFSAVCAARLYRHVAVLAFPSDDSPRIIIVGVSILLV